MTRGAGPKSTIANGPSLRVGRHRVWLPASRIFRIVLGVAFCIGGILSFLPVLGLWMLPVGILILSVDLPPVRRARRRFDVYWGRSETSHRVRRWFRRTIKKIRRK